MATGQVRTEIDLLEFFKDNVTNDIYPVDLRDFVVTMFFEIAAVSGVSSYVYIAYADDAAGTNFTLAFDPAKEYIAIRSTTVEIPAPVAGDFTGLWTKYIGDKGDLGLSLLTGIIDPLPGDGNEGDTFLNVVTYDIFGPKSGGIWGSGTTIIGNGVAGVALQGSAFPVDTYRMSFTDLTFFDYDITNGVDGATGNGVASVVLQGTVLNVDTYRMTFTDATFFDYTVTNSQDLAVGADGDVQIATAGVLDSDSDNNWHKVNKVLNINGDVKAEILKSKVIGQISTAASGWYRVADFSHSGRRGFTEIVINDPGVFLTSFSGTYIIRASKSVMQSGGGPNFAGNLTLENFGGFGKILGARMVIDGVDDTYLEIEVDSAITGFNICETQASGENTMGDDGGATNSSSTIYTGLLSAAPAPVGTIDEKVFIQNGKVFDTLQADRSFTTGGSRHLSVRALTVSGTYQITDHLVEMKNDFSVITLNLTGPVDGRELIVINIGAIQATKIRPIGTNLNIDGVLYESLDEFELNPNNSVTLYYSRDESTWFNYR